MFHVTSLDSNVGMNLKTMEQKKPPRGDGLMGLGVTLWKSRLTKKKLGTSALNIAEEVLNSVIFFNQLIHESLVFDAQSFYFFFDHLACGALINCAIRIDQVLLFSCSITHFQKFFLKLLKSKACTINLANTC